MFKHSVALIDARHVAGRDILCRLPPTLFLLAATVESGKSYFDADLAHDGQCAANEKPVWYCLLSWTASLATDYGHRVLWAPHKREHLEETSVPLNVHFCMHRYGEWFMLMFGEGIMSLLIVEGDNESLNHNLKFYAGILSMTFLANLHFKSEPAGPHADHALSRSRSSNFLYCWFVPIYSMALIATGVCYKMFLYDYVYVNMYSLDDDGNHYERRNLGGNNEGQGYVATNDGHDNNDDSFYEHLEEHQQGTADLFSRSLALVLACTDLNLLLHAGRQAVRDQTRAIPPCRRAFLILSKCASLCFLAVFLSALQNDPHLMTLFGLGAILLQEVWRRCFKVWQQEDAETSGVDDAGVRDEGARDLPDRATVRCCGQIFGRVHTTQAADDDEQYEMVTFESAAAALAKFEQQAMIDESAIRFPPAPAAAASDSAAADSYCQLPE